MTNSKFKRVLSLVLAFVMTASLFTNWPMPVFATSGTDTIKLDFVPENGVPEIDGLYKPGTIRNDSIRLYESTDYGATGVEVSGVQGVTVTVLTSHTINGVKMYEIDCTQEANEEIFNLILDYSFVSSTDIILEGEESLPAPTPYPTIIPSSAINEAYNSLLATATSAEYDGKYAEISADIINRFSEDQKAAVELHRAVLVAYETLMATETVASYDSIYTTCDPNVLNAFTDVQKAAIAAHRAEMYDAENPDTGIYLELPEGAIAQAGTPSGALAAINGTSLIAYKSLDNGAMGVEIPVNAGTVVELITSYTFSNSDLVFYRYDYSGSNEELKDASTGETYGYVFIPASAVTITNEVGTNSYTNEEYGITVSGQIPTGLTLNVVPEDVNGVLADAGALMGGSDWTYDVDLTYSGGEYKTTQGIDVTFDKENVQMPVGANYKAYHIKNDNTVEVLGPFVYDGNDIEVTFNGLSPVGISANVININSRPFEKAVFKNSTVKVYPSDKDNAEPITLTGLTDTDFFTLSGYAPYGYKMSSGEERYYIDWYNGSNTTIAGILNVGSRYLVDINDIEEYVESTPTPTPDPEQPKEVVEAYENLIKAPTLDDFEDMLYDCFTNGIADQFTDVQMTELQRLQAILDTMEKSTDDYKEYGIPGGFSESGGKLYLNPVTYPDEYVVVNSDAVATSLSGEEVIPEEFTVEGMYTAENGEEYYIIDTSSWSAFAGMVPYKYISTKYIIWGDRWKVENNKGAFASDNVNIYDKTLSAYKTINDATTHNPFDVLFSFEVVNTDGTATDWYVINTKGWISSDGVEVVNKYVKKSDVTLITSEAINTAYNDMLGAVTVDEFDSLYSAAQTNGIVDCLTEEQKQALASTRATLAGMAEATVDLSGYNIQGSFANEETKLYPNPVTQPDKYITAVVKEEPSFFANLFTMFPLFITAHAAEEEVTAQEIIIIGKYLADDGTLYYILDVSGWEGLDGIETIYVKASEIDIYVDEATQTTFVDLLTAQSGEELAEMLADLDDNTVAVMTEAGLIDLVESHAEVLEFLAENGSTPIADESVIGMYAQPLEGLEEIFLYAKPGEATKGYAKIILGTDYFKAPFKIMGVVVDNNFDAVYYQMNYSYAPNYGESDCTWIRADAVEVLEDYVDPTEALYLKLMQTETTDEFFALVDNFTDEEWLLIEEMDETWLNKISEHVGSLPSADRKPVIDAYNSIMSTETVEDYVEKETLVSEEIREKFSAKMYIATKEHYDELYAAEDTSPKNVVDYTYTAPLGSPVTGILEQTTYNMRRTLMLAEAEEGDGASPTSTSAPADSDDNSDAIKDTDGVVTFKDVVPSTTNDGYYTVTLETYVTGEKVTSKVETHIPTDIIVVVDQSGSMRDSINKSNYRPITEKSAKEIFNSNTYRTNTYVNVGTAEKPVYHLVTINAQTSYGTPEKVSTSTNNTNTEINANKDDLYYLHTDGNYYKVDVEAGWLGVTWYTYSCSVWSEEHTTYNQNDIPNFTEYGSLYYREETISGYKFSYKDADGSTVLENTYGTGDQDVPNGTEKKPLVGNTYYEKYNDGTERRIEALVRALNNFSDSVREKTIGPDGVYGVNPKTNINDDVDHRIAIVGFSSDGYNNTEILTGCTITDSTNTNLQGNNSKHYPDGKAHNGAQYGTNEYTNATKTALVDMSSKKGDSDGNGTYDGVDNVNKAIASLTAHGGTQTQDGTQMARDIFDANPIPAGEKRNRVVVIFTDGEPGDGNSFSTTIANQAITDTKAMKADYNTNGTGNGATVYTVGIFNTANGAINVTNNGNNAAQASTSEANNFMHYMSSNYKTASSMTNDGDGETFDKDANGLYTGDSYYLSASDSDALNNIFETISRNVENNSEVYELDETTVIKDIVAPNFLVPTNADTNTIKVYTALTTGTRTPTADNPEAFTFDTPVDVTKDVNVSINGKNVDIKGFDFAEEWVGKVVAADNSVSYHGKKLIIEFDIPVDPDFIGGNKVKTNGNESGVYVPVIGEDGNPTGEYTLVENFTRPTVDIPVKGITATPINQHIYRTNVADLTTLFNDVYIYNTVVNGKEQKVQAQIEGTNNAYADITFTVKDGEGNVLGIYFIEAGDTFTQGVWSTWITETVDGEQVKTLVPIDSERLTAEQKAKLAADLHPVLNEDTKYTIEWLVDGTNDDGVPPAEAENVSRGSVSAWVYVYNPTITFNDETVYFGGAAANVEDNASATITWDHNGTPDTAMSSNASKPNLGDFGFEYDYDEAAFVNGYTVKTGDIKVDVTKVTLKGTDITENAKFAHGTCPEECSYADTDTEEFRVHVETATLTIKKTVDLNGSTEDPNEPFRFKLVLTHTENISSKTAYLYTIHNAKTNAQINGPSLIMSGDQISLKHNQYAVIVGLPMGGYKVTETPNAAYETTSSGSEGTFSPSALSATATFVNKLNTGSITITKKVEMPSGFPMPTEKFAIKVAKTDGTYEKTVNLANGESVTLDNLVIGDYTVTEARQILYTTTYTPAQNVKVNPGKDTAVTVENARKLADLEIKKTVVTPAGIDKTGEEFAFKAYITGAVEGETLKVGDQTVTILKDAKGTYIPLTLKHDQSAVIKNLPITAAFEIVETAVAGYTTTVNTANIAPTNTVTGTLPQTGLTGDNAVVFTNTLDTGSLEINKTVISAPGVAIPTEGFTFTVDVNNVSANDAIAYTINGVEQTPAVVDANGNVTITIAHGQTAVLTGLPIGDVVVTETAKDQFTTKVNGADGTVFNGEIAKDAKAIAAYVNTMKTYSLTINKAFATGTSPEVGETFVFTVTRPGGFSQQVVIAVTDKNNDSVVEYAPVTITNLPAGEYTVTEDMSWSKQYTATYSPSQTVVITNADQSVTVTNSKTDKWLKADAYAENKFASYGTAGGVVVENGTAILGDDNNA